MEPCTLIRSRRKTLSIQVRPDGSLVVRAPLHMPEAEIRRFLAAKADWIARQQARARAAAPETPLSPAQLETLKARARELLPRRAAHFAPLVGVNYGTLTVRAQRTRWGSCSAKGNLSFNCLLLLCPPEVIDYVVVHELCHRRQMNHSPRFWALVEQVLPDYRQQVQYLKEHGTAILRRMTG